MDELATAIEYIRHMKKTNRYDGCRIGRLKMLGDIAPKFNYRVDDIVLYHIDGDDKISITRPWNAISFEVKPGYIEHRGDETIVGLTKDYVDDLDYTIVPTGLYEQNYGVGRSIVEGMDALAQNGHREAAFLLLLNVISGLSRRRYQTPETSDGLLDHKEYRKQISANTALLDGKAFVAFVNEELQVFMSKYPEHRDLLSDTAFVTMRSECTSIGDWLYVYYRNMLVHNTKTSSTYRLDLHNEAMGLMSCNADTCVTVKCIGFEFYRLLRSLVDNAVENDESF